MYWYILEGKTNKIYLHGVYILVEIIDKEGKTTLDRLFSKEVTSEFRYKRRKRKSNKKSGSEKTANEKAFQWSCRRLAEGQCNSSATCELRLLALDSARGRKERTRSA